MQLLHGLAADGGLLLVTNPCYRLSDSDLAEQYAPIRSDIVTFPSFLDVFTPAGEPCLVQVKPGGHGAYRTGEGFAPGVERAFHDALFRKGGGRLDASPEILPMAPVPPGFREDHGIERTNTDLQPGVERAGLIVVTERYRFGRDVVSGQPGYALRVSWPSPSRPGETVTWPETWTPVA